MLNTGKQVTFANSEESDEMSSETVFQMGVYCLRTQLWNNILDPNYIILLEFWRQATY